jgi:predicted nucleotidyltransferase
MKRRRKADSDIDILIEFSKTKSLLTLIRIEREQLDFIGVKIDLLTEASIS